MSPESEFIRAELSGVRDIVQNECWLEGERRGSPVDPSDGVVQLRVADIILSGVGEQLRQNVSSSSSKS
jgi:hypothetical protein